MHHPNLSLSALDNQNLCEINIGGPRMAKKPVRRVGSVPLLPTLTELKRPGEYYIHKMSQSALNLAKTSPQFPPTEDKNRPDSLTSDGSKDSDDASLVGLSQFDNAPDSRLSSMTSHLLYSNRTSHASSNNIAKSSAGSDGNVSDDHQSQDSSFVSELSDDSNLSGSLSTITLKNPRSASYTSPPAGLGLKDSASDLSQPKSGPKPKLRSRSTSNILKRNDEPSLYRTNTSGSSFMLSRSKTRYYNPKESKERKQLRKKAYDDNEDDDDILPDDLDLVFNVPVIKNHAELYMNRRGSSSSSLSRHDLVNADDNKYNSFNPSVKPCPLPGKLSKSTLSLDTAALPPMPEGDENSPRKGSTPIPEDEEDSSFSFNNDSEISNNISEFYNQRSVSYSKLVKKNREQLMVYKLPNYIKLQSSVEDLSLFSPEKLEAVDQSRPINLPPKCSSDKAKHNKEFYKNLTSFEHNTKLQNESRKKLGESLIANQKAWFKLMTDHLDNKMFGRKMSYDKNNLRALNWDSIVPEKLRMVYFTKVLSLSLGEDFAKKAAENFANLEVRFSKLSEQMRSSKDTEFGKVIDQVFLRPMIHTFIHDVFVSGSDFDVIKFKENFQHLLYIKSLSESGLKKHHEVFVIPIFLILFQEHESLSSIFALIEMFDKQIFNEETIDDVNKYLSRWLNLALMPTWSTPYKILSKFQSLEEFECLNFTSFFDILVQLNDQMPLSLSAPSTPITAQGSFTPLSSAKPSSEYGEGQRSSSSESGRSIEDFDFNTAFMRSSSLSLVSIFLQLLVVYSNSPKSKKRNFMALYQGFLLTIFKYYHINWNSYTELVRGNKPIKLNNSNDQQANLNSFLTKFKDIFNKM